MRPLLLGLFFLSTVLSAAPFSWGTFYSYDSSGSPLELRINKHGIIRSHLPLSLPQGNNVIVQFPNSLYWDPEIELFATTGFFDLGIIKDGYQYYCRFPVRFEIHYPDPDEAFVTVSFNQIYSLDEFHRCRSTGEGQIFYLFYRK